MSRHYLTITALLGCITGIIFQVLNGHLSWTLAAILLALAIFSLKNNILRYFGFFIMASLVGFGYCVIARAITTPHIAYGTVKSLQVTIVSNPIPKGNGISFTGRTLTTAAKNWRGDSASFRVLIQTDAYPVRHIGDILQLTGTLNPPPSVDGFNYPEVLAHDGVFAVVKNPKIIQSGHATGLIAAFHDWVSARETNLQEHFSEPESSLVSAIVLGDKAAISPALKTTLSNAGMSHLISIGGVTILLSLEALMALWPITHPFLKISLLIFCILALFLLTNGAASVLRGGTFALLQRLVRSTGRRAWPLPLIALTALALLLWNPLEAINAGFLLSVSAYIGLLFLAPIFAQLAKRFHIPALFTASTAIAISTLPVTYFVFGQLSFWTILTSPLIYAVLPYLLLLGILYLIVLAIPVLATLIGIPLWLVAHLLVQTANHIGGASHA